MIDRPSLRAFVAFVSAQSALLYGYALWGGIKEVDSAWALALLVTIVPIALRSSRPRHLIPVAAVTALLFGILSLGAVVWVAPVVAVMIAALIRARGARDALRSLGAFTAFLVVLASPTIVSARAFLSSNLATGSPLANLVEPLSPLQIAGIWPAGDFRFDPERISLTQVLVALAILAATGGAIAALRSGVWEFALFAVGAPGSALVLYAASTPWIAGKAFATASPAIPLAALTAAVLLLRRGRPVEGVVLALLIAGGVFWSNVLQYHDAWLAPRSQLAELAQIGSRFAGEGPALMTEFQPYGVRHFLRTLDGEGASELRFRPVALRNGQLLGPGAYADLDQFDLSAILLYRSLILRRSPVESRPPSVYHLVWSGRWYEVWQRPPGTNTARILKHLSLGTEQDPGGVPRCADVEQLARTAGVRELVSVTRAAPTVLTLGEAVLPPGWGRDQSGRVIPGGAGTVRGSLTVPATGRYVIWVGGSFRDRLRLSVDGRRIGRVRNQLNNAGQFTELGEATLRSGTHVVRLDYDGPDLHPGSGGPQFPLGPLVASTETADTVPVRYLHPSAAHSLCNQHLDWVEALGP